MSGWRHWFAGALIVAALVGAVLHFGEMRRFLELIRNMQPVWLLAAVALQGATYVSLAKGWQEVLKHAEGQTFGLWPLIRIALCKLFADQALPTAGMGGNVLLVDQLVAIGARRGSAVAALLVTMRGFYSAYLSFALLALLMLWLHGKATPLLVGTVTAFVIVALAIPALALWLRGRGSVCLPATVERIRPIRQLVQVVAEAPADLVHDRSLFARLAMFNALIFASDVLTLYVCLRGLGIAPPLATPLIAFVLASIAVTLGPIPGPGQLRDGMRRHAGVAGDRIGSSSVCHADVARADSLAAATARIAPCPPPVVPVAQGLMNGDCRCAGEMANGWAVAAPCIASRAARRRR
jgi:uncharacterized membrane protein YbhN (UPF0104 family)